MTEFFDWLTAADSGLGAERLRERFRLSEDEMRRATEALAPAFLLGLQRLMLDPSAWMDFSRRLSAFAPSGADPASAITGRPAAFLAELFGTNALTDSVARRASMMAGISPDTIAKMMPELALMTVRAMTAMAASPRSGSDAPTDAAGRAAAEWMRRSANALEAFSRPSSAPAQLGGGALQPQADLQALFADALRGGFPWIATPRKTGHGQSSSNAAKDAFPFFGLSIAPATSPAKGATGRKVEPPKAAPEAAANPPATGRDTALDSMAQLAEAGRSLQETYAREMIALFDRHRRTD